MNSRLAGRRRRVLLVGVALALLVGVLAVALGRGSEGDALGRGGSTTGITIYPTSHPRVGEVWDLAFPELGNASQRPIRVVGFGVQHLPAGLRVGRYLVLDARQTHGILTTATPGDADPKFDVTRFHDYAGHPFVILPKHVSHFYALVEVTIMTGCIVRYRQDGKQSWQTLGCDFSFGKSPMAQPR